MRRPRKRVVAVGLARLAVLLVVVVLVWKKKSDVIDKFAA